MNCLFLIQGAHTAVNHAPAAESANSVNQDPSNLSVEDENYASGAVLEITWLEKMQKGKKLA